MTKKLVLYTFTIFFIFQKINVFANNHKKLTVLLSTKFMQIIILFLSKKLIEKTV